MGRKIRVFISSTMKDLANERAAVRRRLEEFNFEPVNAENLGPTGANSWDRLAPEIQSCDLLILLMGERYGWIPPTGPEAKLKRAITEREVDEAKRCGIPVLPFLKRLEESPLFGPTNTSRKSPPTQNEALWRYRVMVSYAQKL